MRYIRPLTCVALLTLLGSCADADGTQHVLLDSLPRLELRQDLRIGSVDAAEEAFTWFRQLVVGDGGRIYTAHPQEQRVRIWSRTGELRGTIESGEGPGELGNPLRMGFVGDTLWIMDGDGYVLEMYDAAGRFLASERLGIGTPPVEGDRALRPDGLLADGTLYGGHPAWSSMIAAGEISADTMFLLDRSLDPIDTLIVRPLEVWAITNPEPDETGFGSYGSQPYGDADLVRLSADESAVYRVQRRPATDAAIDSFRVTKRFLDGDTIYSHWFAYRPKPLEDEVVERTIEERTERYETPPFPGAPTRAQATEWARLTLETPEFLPPITGAVPGVDGTLWLAREEPDSGAVEWIVLSQDGESLGSIAVPERVRVIRATRERVWGSFTDELDVPYVVRYRVEPAALPG